MKQYITKKDIKLIKRLREFIDSFLNTRDYEIQFIVTRDRVDFVRILFSEYREAIHIMSKLSSLVTDGIYEVAYEIKDSEQYAIEIGWFYLMANKEKL